MIYQGHVKVETVRSLQVSEERPRSYRGRRSIDDRRRTLQFNADQDNFLTETSERSFSVTSLLCQRTPNDCQREKRSYMKSAMRRHLF